MSSTVSPFRSGRILPPGTPAKKGFYQTGAPVRTIIHSNTAAKVTGIA